MKKPFQLCLILTLALSVFCSASLAESSLLSAKGRILVPDSSYITAPLSGQIGNFTWVQGDRVMQGDTAFTISPTTLYAPSSGTVKGLQTVIGDQATAIQAQYGALLYIEREDVYHIRANKQGAYNDPENRDIRIGDTLRVKTSSGDKIEGVATVIALYDGGYTLEMLCGDFELEDSVKCYLGTGKSYDNKDCVGSGKISRPDMIAIQGEGVVANILVNENEKVEKGQPLFWVDTADKMYLEAPQSQLAFEKDAVITQILVSPGQYVTKGQALMAISDLTVLQATLEVDELDISKIRIDQPVLVAVDAYPNEMRHGIVSEIRPLGVTILDTTKFLVKVTLDKSDDLLPDMHVTGYWE